MNVVLFLQLSQFLLSTRQLRFRCCRILLRRHMVEHDDVTLLQMKTVQVIKGVFSLLIHVYVSQYMMVK